MVVGQDHITTTLRNAILSKHLAQAFLFCGPRGVGKTTCARILAKTINCENLSPVGEACGECTSCTSFQNQNSYNVHELDAASNNSVDDIRQLNEQVRIPPQYGNFKVYIIDEVHMLSPQAFNAFLKTLEEPPSYAIFILATTEKHKIIPTILSRCQIFDFNRIRNSDIALQLEKVAKLESIPFEEEGLLQIARKADGGMRDALSMFDMISTFATDRKVSLSAVLENLHILDSDYYFRIIDLVLEGNGMQLFLILDEILRKGFDGHHFLLGLAEHVRDLILAGDPNTHVLLEQGSDTIGKLQQQSSRASHGYFLNLLSLANTADLQYRSSKNPRLLTELCLIKMANLMAYGQAIEAEKKKAASRVESFKIGGPSLTEVRQTPQPIKQEFKRTPSLKDKSRQDETVLQNTGSAQKSSADEKSPLDLNKAKENYLGWFRENGKEPVSNWSLAVSEETTPSGFKLTFKSGSIAEENFQDELKLIKGYFSTHFLDVPSFELISSNEKQADLAPYTNNEKFNFLAKRNPTLESLKSALGLDFS